jgi:hypothetical protein
VVGSKVERILARFIRSALFPLRPEARATRGAAPPIKRPVDEDNMVYQQTSVISECCDDWDNESSDTLLVMVEARVLCSCGSAVMFC